MLDDWVVVLPEVGTVRSQRSETNCKLMAARSLHFQLVNYSKRKYLTQREYVLLNSRLPPLRIPLPKVRRNNSRP